MSEVQAILFDFGGTLDNDGVHWFVRMHTLLNQMGFTMDYAEFDKQADVAAHHLATLPDTARLTMEQMVAELLGCIQKQWQQSGLNHHADWNVSTVAELFVQEAYGYLTRNRELLARLVQRFRLGCISNNWGNTAGWCAQFEFAPLFETIIDSTVVGVSKPKPKIFHAALEAMGLPADVCVYVGDHFDCDIVGAHQVGMKTVWVNDGSKVCPDPSIVDYEIRSLTELDSRLLKNDNAGRIPAIG
jgi:putative hydrolase of the HAD superfamily